MDSCRTQGIESYRTQGMESMFLGSYVLYKCSSFGQPLAKYFAEILEVSKVSSGMKFITP